MKDDTNDLIPESAYARKKGVSTRTTYDWEKRGILPTAIRINGRKYRRVGTEPKFDEANTDTGK